MDEPCTTANQRKQGNFTRSAMPRKIVVNGREVEETGPLGPFKFIKTLGTSQIVRFTQKTFTFAGEKITIYFQNITPGSDIIKPGLYYKLDEGASIWSRLDFLSLMLALFLGTSALPHILIRYYTVPSQRAARKSTIVAISAIGFFYILTLFLGTGAMINGSLDLGQFQHVGATAGQDLRYHALFHHLGHRLRHHFRERSVA